MNKKLYFSFEEGKKECGVCRTIKPLSSFVRQLAYHEALSSGWRHICIQCKSKQNIRYENERRKKDLVKNWLCECGRANSRKASTKYKCGVCKTRKPKDA